MINAHTCKLLQTHTKSHTFVTKELLFNTLIIIWTLYVLDYVLSESLLFGTLFQWLRIWSFMQCISITDFLQSVSFSS